MSPAGLKVVEQEQRSTGLDYPVGLSQGGFAVVDITDCQGADHGLERVLSEGESVTVGDCQSNGPTQLAGTLRRDLEALAVEVHRNQFNVARVPPEVETRADPQLQGSSPRLATNPAPAVPDHQPLAAVPGAVAGATVKSAAPGVVGSGTAQHAEHLSMSVRSYPLARTRWALTLHPGSVGRLGDEPDLQLAGVIRLDLELIDEGATCPMEELAT